MPYFDRNDVPVHFPIREDQPYVPRHGWTQGGAGVAAGWTDYAPDLPCRRTSVFDQEVRRARKILLDLGRILHPET